MNLQSNGFAIEGGKISIRKTRRTGVTVAVAIALLLVSSSVAGAATDQPDLAVSDAQPESSRIQDEGAGIGPSVFVPVNPSGSLSGSSSTGTKSPFGASGVVTNAVSVEYSPAGCKGTTDYPHASPGPINPTDASVHGRVRCNVVVSSASTTTVLKRSRWYGMQTLNSDTASTVNKSFSGDATPHWYCKGAGTYSYYGYSNHASVENGTTYTASTSNFSSTYSRFPC